MKKFGIFMKIRLHWGSLVRGPNHSFPKQFGPIEGYYVGVLPVIKDNSSTLRVDSVASSYRKSSKVILLFD